MAKSGEHDAVLLDVIIFFLFRGILIGLLFGIPAGAVGAMTVQRTWRYGVLAGILTGLGSSAADCFYACVGAFGIFAVGITNPAAILTSEKYAMMYTGRQLM